jgi:hypothetical protein
MAAMGNQPSNVEDLAVCACNIGLLTPVFSSFGEEREKNVACVKLRRGKIFRNNAKLFFSAGWVVGYIIVHASRRRLSPTGFRTVANGFKWARSQGARAAAIFKLKEILP